MRKYDFISENHDNPRNERSIKLVFRGFYDCNAATMYDAYLTKFIIFAQSEIN